MFPLGRGLSSLIPNSDTDAEELLERLDSTGEPPAATKNAKKKVSIVEEFEEIEKIQSEPMPQPPLVTPLTFPDLAAKDKPTAGWAKHEEKVYHIPLTEIMVNPFQPRRTFDAVELAELAQSIEQYGILQPLVVRRVDKGYELIAGERRLRAAMQLGWKKVPCVVRREVDSDRSQLELALLENIQRQQLNPIDEAAAYRRLTDEYGMSQDEIAARLGKSRVSVANSVRMLHLPEEVKTGLIEGKITSGHARAILMIPDEEKQIRFYHHLVQEGLTVRKAEVRARRIQRSMKVFSPTHLGSQRSLMARRYSAPLEEKYGFNARIIFTDAMNKFQIMFTAHSKDELEELVRMLLNKGQSTHNRDLETGEEKE